MNGSNPIPLMTHHSRHNPNKENTIKIKQIKEDITPNKENTIKIKQIKEKEKNVDKGEDLYMGFRAQRVLRTKSYAWLSCGPLWSPLSYLL